MAVCVTPFGVSATVPGTTVQVIVAVCGLKQVSVAFPVRPVELRTSGNTAVPPGLVVAVVVPPGGGEIEITTTKPVSGMVCTPFEASLVMVTGALKVACDGAVKSTPMVQAACG